MMNYFTLRFVVTQDLKLNCFSSTSTFPSISFWSHLPQSFLDNLSFSPLPHPQHLLSYHFVISPRHSFSLPGRHRGAMSSGMPAYIPAFSWARDTGKSLQRPICINKAYAKPNHFPIFSWNHCHGRSFGCHSPIPESLPLSVAGLTSNCRCLCLSCPLAASRLCCQHGRLEAAEGSSNQITDSFAP